MILENMKSITDADTLPDEDLIEGVKHLGEEVLKGRCISSELTMMFSRACIVLTQRGYKISFNDHQMVISKGKKNV